MSSWTFNCLLPVILSGLTLNAQTSKALKFLLVFGTSGEGHREGDLRTDSAEARSLEAEHLMSVSNMSLSSHYCLTKRHHVQ